MAHHADPNAAATANEHGAHTGEHGPDHHHITSQRTLLTVLTILIILTIATVLIQKKMPASETVHFVIAMVLATTKAALVCLFFMHLIYDKVMYTVVFLGCLFLMALFIGISMLDLASRDAIDPVRAQLLQPVPGDMVANARYSEDGREGRKLFFNNCTVCHAQDASGVPGMGESLRSNHFILENDVANLTEFLKFGRPASHPLNHTGITMPARGGNPSLTDEQLRQIAVYLKELPPKMDHHGHEVHHEGDTHEAHGAEHETVFEEQHEEGQPTLGPGDDPGVIQGGGEDVPDAERTPGPPQ